MTVRAYRVLCIQCADVNHVYFVIIGASKLILISFAIFCTYGGIRLHGIIAAALAIIGISTSAFLATIVTIWAEFNNASVKAKKALHTYSVHEDGYERKWFKETLVSLPNLKVNVLNMYYIDMGTVLLVVRIVSEGICFFLVNFPAT